MTSEAQSESISSLLKAGIGPRVHWFPEDVSIDALAETMVALANSQGGSILIGIAPRQPRIQGLRAPERAIDRVFQAALQADPPLVLPLPQIYEQQNARILWVMVPAGLPHVYNLNGRYLSRDDRHNITLSGSALRKLMVRRGVVQFENSVPPRASLQELDQDRIDNYLSALKLPGSEDPIQQLTRRGCLRTGADGPQPTYAALLLFGHHPQQWLPNASILAARFSGPAFQDQFIKQEITGTLIQQIQSAEQFVRDHLRSEVSMSGLVREEYPEYPLAAVRELLVNAIAHRDYNVQGDTIHLHIFSNRLEVRSPGVLPGPVNLDNLMDVRFSRNPIIVQVLADLGYIEKLGYGLDRVLASMRRRGLPDPIFEEAGGTFRVTLQRARLEPQAVSTDADPQAYIPDLSRYAALDLNPRQQIALNFLTTHRRITNGAYRQLCPDVHPETLRRDLVDLVKQNVLIKIGDRKATYYILK